MVTVIKVSAIYFHSTQSQFQNTAVRFENGVAFVLNKENQIIFGGDNFTFSIEPEKDGEMHVFDVPPPMNLKDSLAYTHKGSKPTRVFDESVEIC